jgi:hypothetical protein
VMGLARGVKVKWALGASAVLWFIPLLFSCMLILSPSSGAPNPLGSMSHYGMILALIAAGGFLVTAFVLWLLLFVVDALRHATSSSNRQG